MATRAVTRHTPTSRTSANTTSARWATCRRKRKDEQRLALAGDYPAVMPDELDKEQRALPFFQFRAESLVDNAGLKIPGLGH